MRRGYIDWLRGLAVVVMIEAHTLDAWTRPEDRELTAFGYAMILGGLGAPLFLFLAGVAVALSASAKVGRGSDVAAAAAAVRRRGWEIFGLAFLFRLQAFLLSGRSSPFDLFRVDILNIMGLSIVVSAYYWGAIARTTPATADEAHRAADLRLNRVMGFAILMAGVAMITPLIRATLLLDPLPAPLEAYLRPQPGLTNFTFFPWAGFVFAGTLVGVVLDGARDAAAERRAIGWIAVAAAAVGATGYAASYLPTIYERSNFWTSSPTFFFLRAGLLAVALAAAWLWERGPAGKWWSPMRQLGRTSLFIYWIHVELVYGVIAAPIKRQLPFGRAIVAFVLFTLAMLGVSIAKTRIAARWRAPRRNAVEVVR
jgi:uncharacterized membrane protein